MFKNKVRVPFTYDEFDVNFLESLSHDFSKYDGDQDGKLNKHEFVSWLVNGGTKKKIAKHLFYVADSNNDGCLSLEEFKKFAKVQQDMIIKDDLANYVKVVYISVKAHGNSSGGLKKKEFLKFMKLMNTPVGFFKRNKVFKEYDRDKTGRIDYIEILFQVHVRYAILLYSGN
ncbi:hypothetical protein M9Y10_030420 [Tritrichomonas musculus]|uniref:EF-hand domain-containing protein n=1 Tax=Tritrichomonas musculus TaxID=1915356 RepID=A0ABR2GK84_9EUKA